MVKKKTSAQLKRELATLRKGKAKRLELKKKLLARQKEVDEIRKINQEIRQLKGVGTKRAVAKRIGATGASYLWKASKAVGKYTKKKLQEEAAAQDRMEAAQRAKRRKKK